jgi:hypothetical protein
MIFLVTSFDNCKNGGDILILLLWLRKRTHGETCLHIQLLRYQKMKSLMSVLSDDQNPYIEEEQTTQWPKEKLQNNYNFQIHLF